MPLNRREFVASGLMAGLAVPVAATAQPLQKWGVIEPTCEVGSIRLAEFEESIGTTFFVLPMSNSRVMQRRRATLSKVVVLEISPEQEVVGGECFRLEFDSFRYENLTQGTYLFVHERLGAFHMFVVPNGMMLNPDEPGSFLAILNRVPI